MLDVRSTSAKNVCADMAQELIRQPMSITEKQKSETPITTFIPFKLTSTPFTL
jgi:hypothetical protein